jgi:uncharacterized protein (TIGR02452 family)
MMMNRERAAQLGEETRRILAARRYTNGDGAVVALGPLLEAAIAGTRSYPAEDPLPAERQGPHQTMISVRNESTLAAVRRLADEGKAPVALNFASAKHPGGGWLSGARAQEETLARASGLVACIEGNPLYARNAALGDALYLDDAIYAPDVPVFRDDEGRLLPEPYLCTLITMPAANAGVVLERDRSRRGEVRETMARRINRVLSIAALQAYTALVLGAWGCGVFRNDPAEVAGLFATALAEPFHGAFAEVVFAVLDSSPERRFIGPFERAFAGG